MVEEDPPIKERSFRQMEEDRLGAEAARKLYEEEQAELAREQEEMKKKRQEDVINSAKYYTDADWMVDHYCRGEDESLKAQRMDFEICDAFTDDQLKAEFDKIRNDATDLQAQNLRRSLKRPGDDVEQLESKKSKSSVAPQTSVTVLHQSSVVLLLMYIGHPLLILHLLLLHIHLRLPLTLMLHLIHLLIPLFLGHLDLGQEVIICYGIKSYEHQECLATRKMYLRSGFAGPDKLFFQVLSNDESADLMISGPSFLLACILMIGKLLLLAWTDLSKLYGMVVKHYEVNPLAGTGLILWGDLHVLFESTTGGSSVEVWNDQQEWVIRSWKLFPFSGVHVLETFAGKILYMFADTSLFLYSVSLMKKMLKHKLEVEIDGVGNDMTYAVQLIKFIKNQLASSVPSA
ncbi:hypothetical protein Tco_1262893 [Tanacetum coccineum]